MEEKEQLESYERIRPLIIKTIGAHPGYSILNMKSGELILCQNFEEFWDYSIKWGLGTSVEIAPLEDGTFKVFLNSFFVEKEEIYKDGEFKDVWIDLAISSGRGEAFFARLTDFLKKVS